jgi:hypothetical protein
MTGEARWTDIPPTCPPATTTRSTSGYAPDAVRVVSAITEIPRAPAIYAMYGGDGRRYVAYVGIGDDLRRRVTQHLVDRNSSVTTGTGAVGLHPDHVRSVEWWEHTSFSDRIELAAAELVAFEVLDPALRSRGGIPAEARERAGNEGFRATMIELFRGEPAGRLVLPSFAALAERVTALERRLERIESATGPTATQ